MTGNLFDRLHLDLHRHQIIKPRFIQINALTLLTVPSEHESNLYQDFFPVKYPVKKNNWRLTGLIMMKGAAPFEGFLFTSPQRRVICGNRSDSAKLSIESLRETVSSAETSRLLHFMYVELGRLG